MKFKVLFLVTILLAILHSCRPPVEEFKIDSSNFDDPAVVNILNHQSLGNLDSLKQYLSADSDPNHQYLAVRAFASTSDISVIPQLVELTASPHLEVKHMALFALGQLKSPEAKDFLMSQYIHKDTVESINSITNREILRAIGKVGDTMDYNNLAQVKSFRSNDDLLMEGRIRGLMQFHMRSIADEDAAKSLFQNLKNERISDENRQMAAYAIQRTPISTMDSLSYYFNDELSNQTSKEILIPILKSGQVNYNSKALSRIRTILNGSDPELIQTFLTYSKGNLSDSLKSTILPLLNSNNPKISRNAARYMYKFATDPEVPLLRSLADSLEDTQTKAIVLAAALKNTIHYKKRTKAAIRAQITENFESAKDPFVRSFLVENMIWDIYALPTIVERTEGKLTEPLLLTGMARGVKETYDAHSYSRNYYQERRNLDYLKEWIYVQMKSGDTGLVAECSQILRNPKLPFKSEKKDFIYIDTVLVQLNMPAQLEAYSELVKTKNYLFNTDYEVPTDLKRKPSNTDVLNEVKDSSIFEIVTNKGVIQVELFPDLAPITVANFVQLIQKNFYDNMPFHRVVPEFVVQTGCTRGDGYSSLDYVIPSEFSMATYLEPGMLGMASLGPNTESSQFFINTSPSPHLDGRYTIFGRVVQGLDIVKELEQGDLISDIRVQIL